MKDRESISHWGLIPTQTTNNQILSPDYWELQRELDEQYVLALARNLEKSSESE